MNIRCGKYKHLQTANKNKCYKNITIEFTREEYKNWCLNQRDYILTLKTPSIDRIDSLKNYCIDNIQIIELKKNIQKKNLGNEYITGPKCKTLRGIRKSNSKYQARICYYKKEINLGVFDNKKDAYICFYNKFLELRGFEPFDLILLENV